MVEIVLTKHRLRNRRWCFVTLWVRIRTLICELFDVPIRAKSKLKCTKLVKSIFGEAKWLAIVDPE